jgi:hypothetical protein
VPLLSSGRRRHPSGAAGSAAPTQTQNEVEGCVTTSRPGDKSRAGLFDVQVDLKQDQRPQNNWPDPLSSFLAHSHRREKLSQGSDRTQGVRPALDECQECFDLLVLHAVLASDPVKAVPRRCVPWVDPAWRARADVQLNETLASIPDHREATEKELWDEVVTLRGTIDQLLFPTIDRLELLQQRAAH